MCKHICLQCPCQPQHFQLDWWVFLLSSLQCSTSCLDDPPYLGNFIKLHQDTSNAQFVGSSVFLPVSNGARFDVSVSRSLIFWKSSSCSANQCHAVLTCVSCLSLRSGHQQLIWLTAPRKLLTSVGLVGVLTLFRASIFAGSGLQPGTPTMKPAKCTSSPTSIFFLDRQMLYSWQILRTSLSWAASVELSTAWPRMSSTSFWMP